MAHVRLENVDKVFPNGFQAVFNQSLEIKDGEFMVFVGPSGCAKSTTLNMIAGLEEISSGNVYIGDRLVNDLPPKDRDIAMVFQSYALYPHMNVYENMAFGLKLRKFPKDEIDKRVREAAQILGITELLENKPVAMSGGQRQRVAVGRAIVRKPEVFLFDEPLSNLDAKLRVHMRVEITKLHINLGSTMIYVTHDQVEAMTMGDRITVMDRGVIQQVDTPVNLYNAPTNKFVATFIGSPSMNIVNATLEKRGDRIWGITTDKVELDFPASKTQKLEPHVGKEVYIGIRPEDITSHTEHAESKENYVKSMVYVVEQMGNEIYVHFSTGTEQLIARLTPNLNIKSGDNHELWFDMEKAHVFDKETEQNISL